MNETLYADPMSDSDAPMWTSERDPLLRPTIVAVWLLGSPPDPDRLRASSPASSGAWTR